MRNHQLAHFAAASLLLAGMLVACGGSNDEALADAGTDGSADAPEGGSGGLTGTMTCGQLAVANPACASCSDDRCCEQGDACAAAPACAALRACVGGCNPAVRSCADACRAEHPEGVALDSALASCRMRWCADRCYNGADVGCGFSMESASCQTCAQQECCAVGAATNNEPSFWQYSGCVAGCADAACFEVCESDSPTGYGYYMSFAGCLGTSCAAPCAISTPATCGGFFAEGCAACVQGACCGESTSCHGEPACVSLLACRERCGSDATCVSSCEQQYGSGAQALDALDACLQSACAEAC